MKALFLTMLVCFGLPAFASTSVIFSNDGEKGTVMLVGRPGDSEALAFYESLNLPVVEREGKLTKSGEYINLEGQRALVVACVFSPMFKENGTCTLVFYRRGGVQVDGARGLISYVALGQEAQRLGQFLFLRPDKSHFTYQTGDGHLHVEAIGLPQQEFVRIEYR